MLDDGVAVPADQQAHGQEVLQDGQGVQQVHLLEDEAAVAAAEAGQAVLAQSGQVRAVQPHRAQGGPVQPGQGVQEGGLAGARGAHDDGEGAGGDLQVQVAQHVLLGPAHREGLGEPVGGDDGGGGAAGLGRRRGRRRGRRHGCSSRATPRRYGGGRGKSLRNSYGSPAISACCACSLPAGRREGRSRGAGAWWESGLRPAAGGASWPGLPTPAGRPRCARPCAP